MGATADIADRFALSIVIQSWARICEEAARTCSSRGAARAVALHVAHQILYTCEAAAVHAQARRVLQNWSAWVQQALTDRRQSALNASRRRRLRAALDRSMSANSSQAAAAAAMLAFAVWAWR